MIANTFWDKSLIGGLVPPVPPLSPPTAGLFAWYKADSLSLSNNDPVGTWTDSSGNGKPSFVQGNGVQKPAFKTAVLNGKPALYFAGASNQYMNTGGSDLFTGLTEGEIFVVLKGDTGQGSTYLAAWSLPHTSDNEQYPWSDGNIYDGMMSTSRKTVGTPGSNFQLSWHTHSTISTSSEYTAYHNGTQFFTTGSNTFKNTGTGTIGGNVGGYWFNGWIAEIIIYDHKLSGADRTAVHDYIFAKYAI